MPDGRLLEGKRVIVTGASRGIGRAIAIACGAGGATVGVNFCRSEKDARAVADEVGATAVLLPFDVGDSAAVSQAFEAFAEEEVLARVPLKRFVKPEEVADFAVFLLSDRARAITGAIHTIDGGFAAG